MMTPFDLHRLAQALARQKQIMAAQRNRIIELELQARRLQQIIDSVEDDEQVANMRRISNHYPAIYRN